jgi:hypothetical protein
LHTIWEFRELLGHGGSQYVRPDVGLAGGLTQCKKIAAIAESFHSAVVTHNFLAIVDSEALIARARRGDIRVCVDVFDPEPVPADSPIRWLPNVFASPHIAGVTAACRPRCFSFMVDEIERFLAGRETLFDLATRTLANRRGERVQ